MPRFNVQRPSGMSDAGMQHPSGISVPLAPILPTAPAAITPSDALARMGLTCAQWDVLSVPQRQDRLAALLGSTMAALPVVSQRWVTSTMNALVPYCLGYGGGGALLGALATASVPVSGPVEWRRLAITVENRELRTVTGALVPIYPLRVGATLFHWAAPEAAMGWFREADRLLNGRNSAGKSFIELADDGTPRDQFLLMKNICTAITTGADCLNIVLRNDPVVRAIERRWVSGPPIGIVDGPGGGPLESLTQAALYGTEENYGGDLGWYSERSEQPIIVDPSDSSNRVGAGILAKSTRTLFKQYYPFPATAKGHPNVFLQTVGFNLAAANVTHPVSPLEVELQPAVRNGFWVIQNDAEPNPGQPVGWYASRNSAYPTPTVDNEDPQTTTAQVLGRWRRGDPARLNTPREAVIKKDGSRRPGDNPPQTWDWRDFVFLLPFPGGEIVAPHSELTASLGPREYLGYLREMVASLLARRPDQIIQDTRANTMQINKSAIEAIGLQVFMADIVNVPGEAQRQELAPDPTIDAVANIAFTIGGALAGATSGISAVIGGAVGAVLLISNRVIHHPIHGLHKDDLGRWKPTFERGWLSGNPNVASISGAPAISPVYPPGFRIYPRGASNGGRAGLQTFLRLPSLPAEDALSNTEADRILALGSGAAAEFTRLYCVTTLPSDGFATEDGRQLWIQSHPWCSPSLAVMHKSGLRKAAPWIAGGLAVVAAGWFWKNRKNK